jgi:ribosomal protein S18 acetylase RimI-like enzyme
MTERGGEVAAVVADRAIRPLCPSDRLRVLVMTRATGLFWDYEIPIALEVFDDATGGNPSGTTDPDYESAGVELDGTLMGWAVWGPRPGDAGTFDLYWIVVDPAVQGRGVGSELMAEMRRRIGGRAARVVVETSGREDYGQTRAFYRRHGYQEVGRVGDFYGPGDDQVVFETRY